MAAIAYLDSSALLKLVVAEPETPALEMAVLEYRALVTSRLAELECRRAARGARVRTHLQRLEAVLEAVYLLEVTPSVLLRGAELRPDTLRSLDAIHVATARSVGDESLVVLTYDRRMADAARENGLKVAHPGARQL